MRSPTFLHRLRQYNRRAPRRSVLRRLFLDNLPLKLMSLFLAITIWAFVAPQRRGETTEFKFQSPLVLKNIPPSMEITSDLVQSVSVLVRVPRNLAKTVNPNLFQVAIDLRNQLPGAFEYTLSQKNLTYNNAPFPKGLETLQISPSLIPLRLEEVVEKEVPIKSRTAGRVEDGYVIDAIRVHPSRVTVRGPRSRLEELEYLATRPIDVQGLHTSVEMLADLEPPPAHVRVVEPEDPMYRADIDVGFAPMRVLLRDIPVIFENAEHAYRTSTRTLNVHLEGPEKAVSNLTNKTVFAVVDLSQYPPGDYRGLTPKIVLPDNVTVLEQWPIVDLFVLERKISEQS